MATGPKMIKGKGGRRGFDRPQDRSQDGGWPSLGASRASPGGSSNNEGEAPFFMAKSRQQFDVAEARAYLAQTWAAAMQAVEGGNQVLTLYTPGSQPGNGAAAAAGAHRLQGKFLVKLKEAMATSKDMSEA